jgi:hypothetical protein
MLEVIEEMLAWGADVNKHIVYFAVPCQRGKSGQKCLYEVKRGPISPFDILTKLGRWVQYEPSSFSTETLDRVMAKVKEIGGVSAAGERTHDPDGVVGFVHISDHRGQAGVENIILDGIDSNVIEEINRERTRG